jgi:hypothetical protein
VSTIELTPTEEPLGFGHVGVPAPYPEKVPEVGHCADVAQLDGPPP